MVTFDVAGANAKDCPGFIFILLLKKSTLVFIKPGRKAKVQRFRAIYLVQFSLCPVLFPAALRLALLCSAQLCWRLPGPRQLQAHIAATEGQRCSTWARMCWRESGRGGGGEGQREMVSLSFNYIISGLGRTRYSFKIINFPILCGLALGPPLNESISQNFQSSVSLIQSYPFPRVGSTPYGYYFISYYACLIVEGPSPGLSWLLLGMHSGWYFPFIVYLPTLPPLPTLQSRQVEQMYPGKTGKLARPLPIVLGVAS